MAEEGIGSSVWDQPHYGKRFSPEGLEIRAVEG